MNIEIIAQKDNWVEIVSFMLIQLIQNGFYLIVTDKFPNFVIKLRSLLWQFCVLIPYFAGFKQKDYYIWIYAWISCINSIII